MSQAGLFPSIGLAAGSATENGLEMLLQHSSTKPVSFERAAGYWLLAHLNFLVLVPQ